MRQKLSLTLAILTLSSAIQANPLSDENTVSGYLMISTEQQKIALGRYLNANLELVDRCLKGWSLDKTNEYFLDWINDHPQYLRRNLTSAFSTALVDACKKNPG